MYANGLPSGKTAPTASAFGISIVVMVVGGFTGAGEGVGVIDIGNASIKGSVSIIHVRVGVKASKSHVRFGVKGAEEGARSSVS